MNHRIHPAQTVNQVVQHDKEVISDPRVRIRIKVAREAHPVSTFGPSSLPFQMLTHTIKQIYQDVVVVPGNTIIYSVYIMTVGLVTFLEREVS